MIWMTWIITITAVCVFPFVIVWMVNAVAASPDRLDPFDERQKVKSRRPRLATTERYSVRSL